MTLFDNREFMHVSDQNYNSTAISCASVADYTNGNTLTSRCDSCPNKMSTIGHAAFAVRKVKENREKTLQRIQSIDDERKIFNVDHNMEYTPMKYNSKLMNSIWGMYNRYSVHNLKKIMDDGQAVAVGQQTSVGSTATVDRSAGSTKTGTYPAKNLMQNWLSPSDYSY